MATRVKCLFFNLTPADNILTNQNKTLNMDDSLLIMKPSIMQNVSLKISVVFSSQPSRLVSLTIFTENNRLCWRFTFDTAMSDQTLHRAHTVLQRINVHQHMLFMHLFS